MLGLSCLLCCIVLRFASYGMIYSTRICLYIFYSWQINSKTNYYFLKRYTVYVSDLECKKGPTFNANPSFKEGPTLNTAPVLFFQMWSRSKNDFRSCNDVRR